MAKWKVEFIGSANRQSMVIEADEVTWPDAAGSTAAAVQFVNRVDKRDRHEDARVAIVLQSELVAFVNTQYVASIQRVDADEKSDAGE